MKKTIVLLTITCITLCPSACSKDSGGNELPEVVIRQPTAASYLSANNELCQNQFGK